MDLIGLKYFLSAARWLNFTKAADECCITQTAMSLHIAKIEKGLGFRLFDRDHRSVGLTAGGRVFRAEAEELLDRYTQAVRRASAVAEGFEGVLTLTLSRHAEAGRLPRLVREFRSRYPGLEVLVSTMDQARILEEVEAGVSDLGLVFPYDALDHPALEARPFATHRIGVLLPADHHLADRASVSLADLLGQPVVVGDPRRSPRLFGQVQEDWSRFGFRPSKVIEADTADSILFLVEAGAGVALMPSYVGQVHGPGLVLVDLAEQPLSVELSLVYRNPSENPARATFLSFLDGTSGVTRTTPRTP